MAHWGLLKFALLFACWLLGAQLGAGFVVRSSLGQSGPQVRLSAAPRGPINSAKPRRFRPLPHLPQTDEYRSPRNRDKNLRTIHEVRELAQRAELVIALNLTSLNAFENTLLRDSLPDNVTMRAVRKRLFRLAVYDTDFEDLEDQLVGQNLYIFCKDSDAVPAIRAVHRFVNTNPRVKRRSPIKAYSTPAKLFTKANTTYMDKLRTKEESVIHLKRIAVRQQLRLLHALKTLADQKANETAIANGLTLANASVADVNITLSGVNVTAPGGVNMTDMEGWLNKTVSEVLRFTEEVENGTVTAASASAVSNTSAQVVTAENTTTARATPQDATALTNATAATALTMATDAGKPNAESSSSNSTSQLPPAEPAPPTSEAANHPAQAPTKENEAPIATSAMPETTPGEPISVPANSSNVSGSGDDGATTQPAPSAVGNETYTIPAPSNQTTAEMSPASSSSG